MNDRLDLDAYLDRIRWRGDILPTHATLAGLLQAHIDHIPFENLDVLLGRPVRLDLDGLQAKLVKARRGGYCFEHATLFAAVLEAIGFQPVRHAARVTLLLPPSEASRSHMFLSVSAGDVRYVVDPGFGPFASRWPVPLDGSGVPAESPTHHMAREGDHWVLYTKRAGAQSPAWVSTFEVEQPMDFEVANHFTATHPRSLFANRIIASAVTSDGRVNVINRDVTRDRGGLITTSRLADRSALRALLAEHFGFDLPEVETLRVPDIPEWG